MSIRLPAVVAGTRSTFLKAMDRRVWAFALAGVAARLRVEGRRIADVRLALSRRFPGALRTPSASCSGPVSRAVLEHSAAVALGGASPLRLNGYKVPLARALVSRALERLADGATG